MKVYTCFPMGKSKALTMSYDDGKQEDKRLVSIFNKYGIKGTFNINYGIMAAGVDERRIRCEEVKELYVGHEVATHTLTHPTIERCPLVEVATEVLEDRKGLESLTGYLVRGNAYPNGSYNAEIKALFKQLGIEYARVVESVPNYALPSDPLEWHPTCHHNDPALMEKAKYFAEFKKSQYLKLMYVWGHSYEFTDRNNWNVIEEFCEYMGGRDDIWYATNIEIIDYMAAAKNLKFSGDNTVVYNPNAISIWLEVGGVNFMAPSKKIEIKGGTTVDLAKVYEEL